MDINLTLHYRHIFSFLIEKVRKKMWNCPHLVLVSLLGSEFLLQATIIIMTMISNCPPCSFISVLNLST